MDNDIKTWLYFKVVIALIALFLFACKGGGSQSAVISNKDEQAQTSSIEVESVNEAGNDEELPNDEGTAVASESGKTDITRWVDEQGRFRILEYTDVEVKPLINGEEYDKYLQENLKITEIAQENDIQEWSIFYHFFIDTDGSIIDVTIRNENRLPHPLLDAEMLRAINATNGKWTSGKHEGRDIIVRLVSGASLSRRNNQ